MELQFPSAAHAQEVGRVERRPECRSVLRRFRGRRAVDWPNLSTVLVHMELGSGNRLFIRGQGGPLSWQVGQPLTPIEPGTLVWSCIGPEHRLQFHLLLDDEVWERGEPHVLNGGETTCLTPDFDWPEMPRVTLPLQLLRLER